VQYRPGRRWLTTLIVVGVGAVCLLAGFYAGQNDTLSHRLTNAIMNRDLDEIKLQLAQREAELIDARLSESVQRAAGNALREGLTAEHRKRAQLQEEVAFYKGLMAPSSLARGLQIAELEVARAGEGQQFDVQLLLTQVALRRTFIAGNVRIDIIGAYADEAATTEAVLSLTELAELKAYPLKFRFRYFQDLAARITVPEGFLPQRVLVTAKQNGKDPQQATFPWPVS
jgi:hypothetical protein